MSVVFVDGHKQPPFPGEAIDGEVGVSVPAGYTAVVTTLLIPLGSVGDEPQARVAANQAAIETYRAVMGKGEHGSR